MDNLSTWALVEDWQQQLELGLQTGAMLLVFGTPVFLITMWSIMDRFYTVYTGLVVGLTVLFFGNLGMNYLLLHLLPYDWATMELIALLSFVTMLGVAFLIGRFVTWWLADPDLPLWAQEMRDMPEDEMTVIDRRRAAYQAQRRKHRGQ